MNTNYMISLITALFIGGAAGYVGSLMATKKMSLVGDVLSHVALPGIGVAVAFGVNISLGALASLILGIFLIWGFSLRSNLSMEALIGVVFVFSVALGFLFTPGEELLDALFGDISAVSLADALAAVFVSLIVIFIGRKIYSKMMLAYVSEDLALANKIRINKYNLIYLFLIAAIVSFGIKVGGSLLTSALIIVPAAAARNISGSMKQYSYLSVAIGAASVLGGFAIFPLLGSNLSLSAMGSIIILVSIGFFGASLIGKRR